MIKSMIRTLKDIILMIYRYYRRKAREQAELEAEMLRRKKEDDDVAFMREEKAQKELWEQKFDRAYKKCSAYGKSQNRANKHYYRRYRKAN